MFRSKVKFKKRELMKFLGWLEDYIDYRGGMGNRINAFDIKNKLLNKLKRLRLKKGENK